MITVSIKKVAPEGFCVLRKVDGGWMVENRAENKVQMSSKVLRTLISARRNALQQLRLFGGRRVLIVEVWEDAVYQPWYFLNKDGSQSYTWNRKSIMLKRGKL